MKRKEGGKSVAVIAAHPDDEALGCGATMAKHARLGDDVRILILGEGLTSRARQPKDVRSALERLQGCAQAAARAIGAREIAFEGLPDNRFDTIARLDLVKKVERVLDAWRPDVVYTHSALDLNIDHRLCFEATVTALRPLPGSKPIRLLSFEVLSSTEWSAKDEGFRPSVYIDVSRDFDRKLKALGCYAPEMRAFPHPRSARGVRALAELRGSQAGVSLAEGFRLVREVLR